MKDEKILLEKKKALRKESLEFKKRFIVLDDLRAGLNKTFLSAYSLLDSCKDIREEESSDPLRVAYVHTEVDRLMKEINQYIDKLQ